MKLLQKPRCPRGWATTRVVYEGGEVQCWRVACEGELTFDAFIPPRPRAVPTLMFVRIGLISTSRSHVVDRDASLFLVADGSTVRLRGAAVRDGRDVGRRFRAVVERFCPQQKGRFS